MTPEQVATFVGAELIWETRPTLIAAMLHVTSVQDVVTALSANGFNTTATRLYNAWEQQRKAIA